MVCAPDAVNAQRFLTTEFMRVTRTPSSNILSTASIFVNELARTSSTRHSGCVDWCHANGQLYQVHRSGTRNLPRVWGIGKALQATQTQPVEVETVYLDGSLTTCDVGLGRAGWRVAMLDVDEQNPDVASLSAAWLATLDGEQTVPCAELAALWWELADTNAGVSESSKRWWNRANPSCGHGETS